MRHVLFTLKQCNPDLLDDVEFIRETLTSAAAECNSTLLGLNWHKFFPCGVTAIAMLAESHISIHTWPEDSMAVCDVFTCGDHTDPHRGVEYMKQMLQASEIISNEFTRPIA